jgi:hypothetical protein
MGGMSAFTQYYQTSVASALREIWGARCHSGIILTKYSGKGLERMLQADEKQPKEG